MQIWGGGAILIIVSVIFPVASFPVAASLSCRFFLLMMWMCVTLGSLWQHFSLFTEFWQSKQSMDWWRKWSADTSRTKRIFSCSLIQNSWKWAPARPTPGNRSHNNLMRSQRTEERTQGTFDSPEYFYSDNFKDILLILLTHFYWRNYLSADF